MQTEKTRSEKIQAGGMQAERLRQIEDVFHRALERPASERVAFLAEACAGDEALRREVESLLAAHEQGGSGLAHAVTDLAAEWAQEQNPQPTSARILGPYRLLSLLGKGGMGEVRLAHDIRLGRKVALKLLPAEFTGREDRLRRFEQEARAASALNHPNIITIYEIGQADSTHFIATEFVEGQTLRRLISSRQLKLIDVLEIALQVAGALAAAHAAGITHRDIKPENLMVRPDGLVKVLDFGLAKLIESRALLAAPDALTAAGAETEPGMVMGTALYMSPEQARGQALDGRTDIFSLGIVLYEMLTGSPPFDGATTIDVLAAVLNREPTPLTRYNAAVPERLEQIVSKTLCKDREGRYQSASDLLTDLKELKQELELEAKRARAEERPVAATLLPRQLASRNTEQIEVTRTGASEPVHTVTTLGHFVGQLKRHRTSLLVAVAALALGALAAALGAEFWGGKASRQINSLAVLPFTNSGADPEVEYLCDGITESLINRLSQLSHLKVMSRGAAFRYKGRGADARVVGRELGVSAVLTGVISQRGDELLINIELVDARDNSQIWGERYRRSRQGALAEEEIAREISAKLRLRLSAVEQERLAKRYTTSTEAFHLYLRGRYIWSKRQREAYGKAIEYFQQALEKDPTYALAYAGLADIYVLGGGGRSGRETYPKAKAAATEALKIDETLAEAHTALGSAQMFYDWNLAVAEAQFKRALDLNPNYATAHQWYADCLAVLGRTNEALEQMRQARELDPLSEILLRDTGRVLYYARRYDEALAQCNTALETNAKFYPALVTLGDIYTKKQAYNEAIACYQESVRLVPSMAMMKGLLANAYALSGRQQEARQILDEFAAQENGRPVPAFDLAVVYLGLGRKDEAFAQLEKAYEERFYRLVYLGVDPLFDPLRADEQFKDLLRRIGLTLVPQ
jgi:eukaryotic-like serine/threonine-protein kinase